VGKRQASDEDGAAYMADGDGGRKASMGHACLGGRGSSAPARASPSPTGPPEIAFLIYGSA
jgi:hypothetical protein